MSTPFGHNKRKLAIKDPEPPAPIVVKAPAPAIQPSPSVNLCRSCGIQLGHVGELCLECQIRALNRQTTQIQQNTLHPETPGLFVLNRRVTLDTTPAELRTLNLEALAKETLGFERFDHMSPQQGLVVASESALGRAILAARLNWTWRTESTPPATRPRATPNSETPTNVVLVNGAAYMKRCDECRCKSSHAAGCTLSHFPLLPYCQTVGCREVTEGPDEHFCHNCSAVLTAPSPADRNVSDRGDSVLVSFRHPRTREPIELFFYKRCPECRGRGSHNDWCQRKREHRLVPLCPECNERIVDGDPQLSKSCNQCVPF